MTQDRDRNGDGSHDAMDTSLPSSETTPLLGSSGQQQKDAPQIVVSPATPVKAHANGGGEEDGGDDGDDGGVRSDGNPELMKKMPMICAAVGIGVYLGAMEQLLAATIYPKIGSDLDALNSTSWIATAYFLTLTCFQPLYGKLSDIFGRKECLLFAYSVFGLGCLGCGLAQTMTQLCVARAVAGVGGAGMAPVVAILLSDIVPLRDRGLWQGYLNIIFGAGSVTGAPLGGFLSDSFGWRWAFMCQVPICVAAFVAVSIVIPSTVHPATHTLLAKLRRVDFFGALTLIISVVTLLFGLDSGANRGWAHTWTVSSLAVSAPFFALFALVETRIATDPFAPARVALQPDIFATNALALLAQGAQMSVIFLIPLFFQAVLGFSASHAGALLIPNLIALVVGAVSSGYVMRHTGRYRTLIVTCQILTTLALSVVASGIAAASAAVCTIGLTLGSLMVGPIFNAIIVALLAQMPEPTDTAVVVACQYLFRSLGNSVGVAASAAVLQNVLQSGLVSRLDGSNYGHDEAREIARKVRRSLDYIKELEPEVARIVKLSYRDAALASLAPVAVMMVLGVVASLFIKNKTIKR